MMVSNSIIKEHVSIGHNHNLFNYTLTQTQLQWGCNNHIRHMSNHPLYVKIVSYSMLTVYMFAITIVNRN